MPQLILASTSPHRRALLERLGQPFTCIPPQVDEDAVKLRHPHDPRRVAEELADAKAAAVAALHPDAVVIGSDQVGVIDGRRLDKPGSSTAAQAMLAAMQGREHVLLTAVTVRHGAAIHRRTHEARLAMRPLTAEQIAAYVARDRPLDCAGAYKLEAGGIALFSAVATDDHTGIVGLPLCWLGDVLGRCGIAVPS